MARVELTEIAKTFGQNRVIHGIDLVVDDGEFVVFVGPSGCGKSTLLRMIAGLETITEGTIRIGDAIVNDLPPRARDIAMVFQDYALYPHKSVYDNICFGLRLRRMSAAEIDRRVREAADILQIAPLLDRYPRALSGGQRQRVAMGRAIVRHPQLFLFDEPLSNLDALLRNEMRTEIKKLHRRLRATSVYVTHDQVEAMTLADRIAVLSGGRLMQLGSPDDIYHRPASRFVASFTGSPPMNFLRARVARPNGVALVELGDGRDRFALPAHWQPHWEMIAGRELDFGIRPEDIDVVARSADTAEIASHVIVTEPLGAENLVTLRTAAGELTGRFAPGIVLRPDDAVQLRLDLSKMHLFDVQTGQALRP
ncbi:MAG TPA: sn-glycerol-3-phosphate ABC transporter ATP-binding protein UgpC [Casimicrobiaceae bacterium]|nr:sn-glycerol-3-phosphate ABC transporter ATP-binding protein UgpC [Casimicrobiaceae bacterium]